MWSRAAAQPKTKFLPTPSARRATGFILSEEELEKISTHALREEGDGLRLVESKSFGDFYPRPPRGGRRARTEGFSMTEEISTHALREEGDFYTPAPFLRHSNFYPRPPRGGRLYKCRLCGKEYVISTHALREEGDDIDFLPLVGVCISTHALREEGDAWLYIPYYNAAGISTHALREEGDSKNGEKHLRFCFIIKRSAQIWKSLSKNIRKKSCDLHRTA